MILHLLSILRLCLTLPQRRSIHMLWFCCPPTRGRTRASWNVHTSSGNVMYKASACLIMF